MAKTCDQTELQGQRSVRYGLRAHLLVLAALAFPVVAQVQLASDRWPPFADVPGQSRVALALVEEALSRAGYDVETTIVEVGALTEALRDGKFDGSATLWRDSAREEYLLFSNAYLENRLVLVGRSGTRVVAESLADLVAARVAIVGSYAYGDAITEGAGPDFVPGQSHQQNLERLLAGDVDFMLVDDLLVRSVLENQAEEVTRYLAVGTEALVRRQLHFAVRKDLEGAAAIIERFNEEIRLMVADGTFNQLLGLQWIHADADGDGRVELIVGGGAVGTEPPTSGYAIPNPEGDRSLVWLPDRYWIDGRAYEGWDQVPERYKGYVDPMWRDTSRQSMTVFKFKF